jgi:predicted Zn-dependent protease
MQREAEVLAEELEKVYGFRSRLTYRDLSEAFMEVPQFDGFFGSSARIRGILPELNDKKVMVINNRDVYAGAKSKDDDWIFGFCGNGVTLVSAARMKRWDNLPSEVLEVQEKHYLDRLKVLAIHEVGHDVVEADHHELAYWVNARTGHRLWLGPHCNNNTCVMYEVVDIRAPPSEEGYLLLGKDERYDAGLDDVLERIRPDWFCEPCKNSIRIGEGYREF